MSTHTLTALYSDAGSAERAAERLRAMGVPEASLEVHPKSAGDMPASGRVGILDIADPLLPRDDVENLEAARTVLVASGVPENLASEAGSVLREEAIEVDDDEDAA